MALVLNCAGFRFCVMNRFTVSILSFYVSVTAVLSLLEKNRSNSSGDILKTGLGYKVRFKNSALNGLMFGGKIVLIWVFFICRLRSL